MMALEIRRFSVISALEPFTTSELSNPPLHLKLLPWFTTRTGESEVVQTVSSAISNHLAEFIITGSGEAYLSEQCDHRARIIGEHVTLCTVHGLLLKAVSPLSPQFDKFCMSMWALSRIYHHICTAASGLDAVSPKVLHQFRLLKRLIDVI